MLLRLPELEWELLKGLGLPEGLETRDDFLWFPIVVQMRQMKEHQKVETQLHNSRGGFLGKDVVVFLFRMMTILPNA